jgi:hypothetical protein
VWLGGKDPLTWDDVLVQSNNPGSRGCILRVQHSKRAGRFDVVADGRWLTSRSGTAALRELADRLGFTDALSVAAAPACPTGCEHDPGAVLRDLIVTLADGGDDFSAIEVLRGQAALFGPVASDSTAWRRVADLAADAGAVRRLDRARRALRRAAWHAGAAPTAAHDDAAVPWCVDVDATLVTAHSDKEQAAGTFKGGYGFHPLLAYLDRGDGTGEALAGLLRPGNAGASTADDHVEVAGTALAQLPDDARVVVRADSAGASRDFLAFLHAADVAFSVSLRLSDPVKQAIRALHADPHAWTPAIRQDGAVRERAHVAEATGLVDLAGYPAGSRLLIRREPLHPGAQQTFDDEDGYRFTAMLTDQPEADVALLDARHRGRARVEQRIEAAKATGLANLPSHDFGLNQIWLQLVLAAQDLLAFFAALALDDVDLRVAEPKTIRYRVLHVAGRITRSARRPRLHLDRAWPWARDLVTAFTRVRALPVPT